MAGAPASAIGSRRDLPGRPELDLHVETLFEELEDLIERNPGGCSLTVVEVFGQHRVSVLRVSVGVAG